MRLVQLEEDTHTHKKNINMLIVACGVPDNGVHAHWRTFVDHVQ